MPIVEVFERDEPDQLLFSADLTNLPRPGEYIARDMGDYVQHYAVLEVWHQQDEPEGKFRACLLVKSDG